MLAGGESRQVWILTGVTLIALLALCLLAGTAPALIPVVLWAAIAPLILTSRWIPDLSTVLPEEPFAARPPTRGPPA